MSVRMVNVQRDGSYSCSQLAVLPPPVSLRIACLLPFCWRKVTSVCITATLSCRQGMSGRMHSIVTRGNTYGGAVGVSAAVVAIEVLVDCSCTIR